MHELSAEKINIAIKEIDNLDLNTATVSQIEELLTPLLTGLKREVPRFHAGIDLYRARIRDKPLKIKEITCPPSNLVTRMGRANEAGESCFYAAISRNVPFFELDCKPGEFIALSRWKTKDKLLLNHVGFSANTTEQLKSLRSLDQIYNFIVSTKSYGSLNQKVHDYLAFKFSKPILEDEYNYYKLTIAIGRKLFKDAMFQGLIYPSIAMAGNADNIVLKKDASEKILDFISVEYIKIIDRQGLQFKIQVVDSAKKTGPDETILWSGRPLHWVLKEKDQELKFVSEDGKWVAYDSKGNKIDPE